jgi:hypothetical protein
VYVDFLVINMYFYILETNLKTSELSKCACERFENVKVVGALSRRRSQHTNVGGQSPGRSQHTNVGGQSPGRSQHAKVGA